MILNKYDIVDDMGIRKWELIEARSELELDQKIQERLQQGWALDGFSWTRECKTGEEYYFQKILPPEK